MLFAVALADACVTEWRILIFSSLTSCSKLHSLMLVLLNGGVACLACYPLFTVLHSLMLVLLNGGYLFMLLLRGDYKLHSLMLVLLNGG